MNLLMINHNTLASNSGIHISNLANAMAGHGFNIAVVVPNREYDFSASTQFDLISYDEAAQYRFADGQCADLIHAWTPRQHVSRLTRTVSIAHLCPYLVHLEDNEVAISSAFTGLGVEALAQNANSATENSVPDYLSEPLDMAAFLDGAAGVTVLTGKLKEFVPAKIPSLEFWPAAEDEFFKPQPPDPKLRAKLRIPDDAVVVVYHGNVHAVNVAEVRSLYIAVSALARTGLSIRLVRLGTDYSQLFDEHPLPTQDLVIDVPFQSREHIPRFLALADFFVQPGRSDAFNDYRFPSKLPEFFAMKRPVVLPAANVGLETKPDVEALLLDRGDAIDIAEKIRRLIADPALAGRLAEGAREFYDRALSWTKSASSLMAFYAQVLGTVRLDRLGDVVSLERAAKLYSDFKPPTPLSYGTVRDYSDSVERLAALSTINQDLKDVQRPWVFKALLGAVPRGGKLLEIGAGDPWVADLLAQLGYDVVVVDPYDGRSLGPNAFEEIKAAYPRLKFLRGTFPDALPESMQDFDCIYSISVLEHLPHDAVRTVLDGIAAKSKSGVVTIHAVDHVLLGKGAKDHRIKLKSITDCLGFDEDALSEVLQQLEGDPDVYFLSAESHIRWRGSMSYDAFPMRRCVSIQICAPATPVPVTG